MKILITGGDGKLATRLKKYLHGDFLGKEKLDLTNLAHINNLQTYDILIHTATNQGNVQISLGLLKLIQKTKPKKIYAFTSRQGTYLNWKKNTNIEYGLEKLLLNFIVYRHNLQHKNALLIEPGHMTEDKDYDNAAKLFYELYCNKIYFEKNMIYNLITKKYIPY